MLAEATAEWGTPALHAICCCGAIPAWDESQIKTYSCGGKTRTPPLKPTEGLNGAPGGITLGRGSRRFGCGDLDGAPAFVIRWTGVLEQTPKSTIPESFLEHRQTFGTPWVDRWNANPFIGLLFPIVRKWGVALTDFSFNKDATNVGETYMNVVVRKLSAALRVGLDNVTYIAANPDWSMAPQLVELFDSVASRVEKFVEQAPTTQQLTLAFHVTAGDIDLKKASAQLVNRELLGDAEFFGISLHQENGSIVIDKSLRYENAAFIRLQRTFPGEATFAEIAPRIYEDEVKTLSLIGITGVV